MDIEEELIHICEPEIGRHLSDKEEVRSYKNLINRQERRDGFSYFQVGNEMRSLEDLIDCQVLLGDLYVLKKTLNYPQLNCQPRVSKLRVVEKYMPKVKGW
jgi:hypothetical protein